MSLIFSKTIYTVQLDSIKNLFDVRTKLDEDRILQLAGAYESGVPLPPAKIVRLDTEEESYAWVDGRHRGAARAFLNKKDIDCVICDKCNDQAELYTEALSSNWGGAKPPTRQDLEHTVVRLLEIGCSIKDIRDRLQFLPRGSLNSYISAAQNVLFKRRIRPAIDAIALGKSIEDVATTYKLKPDQIRNAITGRKKKYITSHDKQVEADMKAYITNVLKSANTGIAKKLDNLLRDVDEGRLSSATVGIIIHAWREHCRKTMVRIEDWHARLNAISHEQDLAAGLKGENGDTSGKSAVN